MNRRLAVAVLCITFFIAASSYASQMYVPTDYGLTAKAIGMGNAMTAVDNDAGLMYYNPATMAKYTMSQLNLGYLLTSPKLQGGPEGNLRQHDEGNNVLIVNLVNNHRSFLRGDHPFAFGLNMYFDRDGRSLINFLDMQDQNGHFYRYGRVSTTATLSLGFGITNWLYLGGGAIISLRGDSDFILKTDMAGNSRNEGMNLDARLYYSGIAAFYLDFEKIDIGMVYHGENYGQMGPIIVDAEATVGDSTLTKLPMWLSYRDGYIPTNYSLGVCWQPRNDLKIAADLVYFNWGHFDRIVASSDLPRKDLNIDFIDTYVPRAGLEYFFVEKLPVRAGYSYQMSPMRKPGNDVNVFLDNDRHVGSVGLGYTFKDLPVIATPVSLDAAFFHQYLVPNSYKTKEGTVYESEGNVNGGVVSLTLRF